MVKGTAAEAGPERRYEGDKPHHETGSGRPVTALAEGYGRFYAAAELVARGALR